MTKDQLVQRILDEAQDSVDFGQPTYNMGRLKAAILKLITLGEPASEDEVLPMSLARSHGFLEGYIAAEARLLENK